MEPPRCCVWFHRQSHASLSAGMIHQTQSLASDRRKKGSAVYPCKKISMTLWLYLLPSLNTNYQFHLQSILCRHEAVLHEILHHFSHGNHLAFPSALLWCYNKLCHDIAAALTLLANDQKGRIRTLDGCRFTTLIEDSYNIKSKSSSASSFQASPLNKRQHDIY